MGSSGSTPQRECALRAPARQAGAKSHRPTALTRGSVWVASRPTHRAARAWTHGTNCPHRRAATAVAPHHVSAASALSAPAAVHSAPEELPQQRALADADDSVQAAQQSHSERVLGSVPPAAAQEEDTHRPRRGHHVRDHIALAGGNSMDMGAYFGGAGHASALDVVAHNALVARPVYGLAHA